VRERVGGQRGHDVRGGEVLRRGLLHTGHKHTRQVDVGDDASGEPPARSARVRDSWNDDGVDCPLRHHAGERTRIRLGIALEEAELHRRPA
jgi:hypothetical protein